jgi:hypothetical protein
MSAEYGVFNAEGLIEAGFWTFDAADLLAINLRQTWEHTDGEDGDSNAQAYEICPDHEEQPLDGCEECAEEEEEDQEDEGDDRPSAAPPAGCGCMTEPDPLDPQGPERVLTHSSGCEFHPEYDGPIGAAQLNRGRWVRESLDDGTRFGTWYYVLDGQRWEVQRRTGAGEDFGWYLYGPAGAAYSPFGEFLGRRLGPAKLIAQDVAEDFPGARDWLRAEHDCEVYSERARRHGRFTY